jgi:hypothetical protein
MHQCLPLLTNGRKFVLSFTNVDPQELWLEPSCSTSQPSKRNEMQSFKDRLTTKETLATLTYTKSGAQNVTRLKITKDMAQVES